MYHGIITSIPYQLLSQLHLLCGTHPSKCISSYEITTQSKVTFRCYCTIKWLIKRYWVRNITINFYLNFIITDGVNINRYLLLFWWLDVNFYFIQNKIIYECWSVINSILNLCKLYMLMKKKTIKEGWTNKVFLSGTTILLVKCFEYNHRRKSLVFF